MRGLPSFALKASLIVLLGLPSRLTPDLLPDWYVGYAGDFLWAVLLYCLIDFALKRKPSTTLWLSFAIACGIEASQLLTFDWLVQLRQHFLAALVLGRGFLWSDVLLYTLGIGSAYLTSQLFARSAKPPIDERERS